MNTRRNFLAMVVVSMVGGACTATAPSAEPKAPGVPGAAEVPYAGEVQYAGPLPDKAITPQDNIPWPCPSCALAVEGEIRGMLKTSTGYGSGHFPIQWMKAIYKDGGIVQGTEWIDIGDGTPYELIQHEVNMPSFDEILIQWKDAEDVIETLTESIPFES